MTHHTLPPNGRGTRAWSSWQQLSDPGYVPAPPVPLTAPGATPPRPQPGAHPLPCRRRRRRLFELGGVSERQRSGGSAAALRRKYRPSVHGPTGAPPPTPQCLALPRGAVRWLHAPQRARSTACFMHSCVHVAGGIIPPWGKCSPFPRNAFLHSCSVLACCLYT